MPLRIEPLDKDHDRTAFSSGRPEIDDWFRLRAGQDERRNVARVYVAIDDQIGIIGCYSLTSFSLGIDNLPEEVARKLPRYDTVPAALIGRLARDERVRGQGIGELLLVDAIKRILGAGRSIAVYAVIVDAKDPPAAVFYQRFGFQSLPSRPLRLFLPVATAAASLQRSR